MMKKLTALLCAILMIVSLAACGGSGDQGATQATTAAQTEDDAAEKAFAKAFEADKNYDIDAMAEVEYSVNFSESVDKEKRIQSAKDSLKEIDEETLNSYKEQLKDAEYHILEQTTLGKEEMQDRIAQLESQYRDTDKITEIRKLTYNVTMPDEEEPLNESAVEMIKVDGVWYCFMGETTWQ